jgi:teichuronic acid biosynthesis protein TuaE
MIAVYPAGIFGASIWGFYISRINFYPYRLLIIFVWGIFIISIIAKKGTLDLKSIKVKAFGLFLLIWLIYSLLSFTWSIQKWHAFAQVTILLFSFSLIAFSVMFFDSVDDIYIVMILWLVVLGVTLLIGVSETISGYHLPFSRHYQTNNPSYLFTPTAVFYNPNNFASFLTLSTPFVLSFFFFSRKYYRIFFLLMFLTLLYVLILTGSRLNYLALFIIIVYFIAVALFSRRNNIKLYILIIGSLLLLLVFRGRVIQEIGSTMYSIQSLTTEIADPTTSIGIRINLIRNGFSFLLSTWGFGVGAGNFETWMQTRALYGTGNIINTHNWFLEVLVNYGIYIFIGYVVFYWSMLKKTYKILRTHWDDPKMRLVGVAILGSLVGLLLASMVPSSVFGFKPHWLIHALGLSYINIGMKNSNQHIKE